LNTVQEAIDSLNAAWAEIKTDCLEVLGSELHYQAMVYHSLIANGGIPKTQIGMNVKMWIDSPISKLFQELDGKKHKDFQGGFEPIPDVVIFKSSINSDWRRRNNEATLLNMLLAIEIKASERQNSRLQLKEIITDIEKLSAHREEVCYRGADVFPVMMIIDSAPLEKERMTKAARVNCCNRAKELGVGFMYCSSEMEINTINSM
jgi:hypothetical protein